MTEIQTPVVGDGESGSVTLLVIVPSRGRPASIDRLWKAIKLTSTTPTELLVVLDDDDTPYPRIDGVHYLVIPRARLAGSYNAALAHIKDWPHQYLAYWNDDHVPETFGWDRTLIGEIENLGGTGIAYADDSIQPVLCTAPIVSRNIPDALGWIGLPGLTHWFIDNVWLELGQRLGKITRRPDVMIRHHHTINGLAPMDTTYAEGGMNNLIAATDRDRYLHWLNSPEADLHLERLRAL